MLQVLQIPPFHILGFLLPFKAFPGSPAFQQYYQSVYTHVCAPAKIAPAYPEGRLGVRDWVGMRSLNKSVKS